MSSLVEFLSRLRVLDVTLSLSGDRLICKAPKNTLTDELKRELAERKAEILEFLRSSEDWNPSFASNTSQSGKESSLSRSQQRLWFLDQLDPGNPVYNIAFALRFTGCLNREALEGALAEILQRHEVLRTSFVNVEGAPVARVESARDWRLGYDDLRPLGDSDIEDEAMRLARTIAREPFQLNRGPAFRASLLQTGNEEHLLVVVMHHIVSDGWSLGVMGKELGALYKSFAEGTASPLPPLECQFSDFVRWEKQATANPPAEQLSYWQQRLGGELPVLDLSGGKRRPPIQTFSGKRSLIHIERALVEKIQQVGRHRGATPFMVLLAAFKVLLSRYSGLTDVTVGTPTAGRVRREFEDLIGFFVTNLVLRTELSGNPSFSELLKRIQTTAIEAYEHQGVPFDRLVEMLQPQRVLDRSPLFQVMFALQNLPLPELHLAGLDISLAEFDAGTSRFDLAVEIWSEPKGYRCYFEYNTELFSEATIGRMQQHYVRLLEGAVADPECRIGELPMLGEAERQEIVYQWNRTECEGVGYKSVPEWFRAQVEKSHTATAVVMGDKALSYDELDQRSDALAAVLHQAGVGREVVVGVFLERSLEMMVALLAIQKAGGAYLPLDPGFPAARLAFLASDAAVGLVLTQRSLREQVPAFSGAVLCVDAEWPKVTEQECVDAWAPEAEDLAYLIYTSGSTGNPKGTQITQGALVNLLASMQQEPGLREQDTLLAITTLSFDIAGLELFLPLLTGARLVVAARETVLDPEALAGLLESSGATVMQATPSGWRMLVEGGWKGKRDLRMWCGGEGLAAELATTLLTRGRELWNLYGPTETTIWSAAHRVEAGEDPILIGRPIANTRMYILDEQRQPVPVGVAGELYIAGEGLARGYWGRPELTAERFVPEVFRTEAGLRMYRTGDLARYRADSQIQLLGRIDQQVKLRGHRIELGEIEAVMEQHPQVLQAVVILTGTGSDQRLVAYARCEKQQITSDDLRAWLEERLPGYMLPSAIVQMSEFPRTPNEKVDRKRLPHPADLLPGRKEKQLLPQSSIEEQVSAVWSEVLNIQSPGIRDNFFDIGGHSLLLVRVHDRLRQQFGQKLAVIDLFKHPTIESIASFLERSCDTAVVAGRVAP
jgi:amino acid adenylation domain-containing protein